MADSGIRILGERQASILDKAAMCCSGDGRGIACEKASVSGAVSQRACVYCGARVVLNPITDAYHIVHGPIGCSSYTWDIRGSLSSGSELYRNSFSTDLRETDVIFGGEKKLAAAIDELVAQCDAKLIFVYATCIVGVIGDDVDAVCLQAEQKYGIRCIPVKAPGFSGTKSLGYKMACHAILQYILPYGKTAARRPKSVNILGDFNLAGEIWIIRNYMKQIGVEVLATITGDASSETLAKAPGAALNLVQCAGSSMYLANMLEEQFGTPLMKVSFFGVEDTSASLMRVAQYFDDPEILARATAFTQAQSAQARSFLKKFKPRFAGKKAAIYVGGGFKAISLIRQFREMGIETVVVGTQTGKKDDYEVIGQLVGPDTVILDDASPAELEKFMIEKGADILVGGVKERPLAYKLGVAFCDHNHERKHALAGYEGVRNFTQEVNLSINSPVWKYSRGETTAVQDEQKGGCAAV